MTVSDPGAGQQQGQECDHEWGRCLYCPATFAPSPTPPARDSGRDEEAWDVAFRFGLAFFGRRLDSGALTRADISDMLTNAYRLGQEHSGGPAPDPSAHNEAREAVARWLWEQDGYAGSWEREDQQDYYREDADRLLALPELDKLLRRPA